MPRTLKNNVWLLNLFVGREAFSPVCKDPPYEILVFLMNLFFLQRNHINYRGKSALPFSKLWNQLKVISTQKKNKINRAGNSDEWIARLKIALQRAFLGRAILIFTFCFVVFWLLQLNAMGFVDCLFVTEMMNCFVELFPRYLDWFSVATNSVHPLNPICVVCLGQKLFLSLTSAFPVSLLIL